LEAAWRESLAPDRKRPKRRGYRRALVGALSAATLTIAGVVGYAVTHQRPVVNMVRDQAGGPASVASASPMASPAPSHGRAFVWDDSWKVANQSQAEASADGPDPFNPVDAPTSSSASSAGPATLPTSIDNIIKTGSLSVVVPKGEFQSSLQAANDIAANYGGYVQSSSTTGTRSGRLTIRVPADKFEAAIGDLQALGRVERESSIGEDVTADFVDLQARLKIAEQREVVVSRLMDRANGISQVLQYRNLLEEAQLSVEQLKGQLRVLRDRSSLGTITLSLREEGVAAADAVSNPSLGRALKHSLEGFLRVLFAVIVGLGYLIPIAALAAAAGWLFRRARRNA